MSFLDTFSLRRNKDVNNETYKVGSVVPDDGLYICVPCGSKKFLKAGARFTTCLQCFGKKRRLFRRGLELWEKIHEKR